MDSSWFISRHSKPRARIRLFCIPYAGGGASIYRDWSEQLPEEIDVVSIQLPGREQRLSESPLTRLDTLTASLTRAIIPHLNRPFSFFGHSMGALVAYDLSQQLRAFRTRQPTHLFVSGFRAPHLPDPETRTYHLPDQQFLDEISRLEGTPPEVLKNPELVELLLPTLRADFEVVQTFRPTPPSPLNCHVTAFGGKDDREVLPNQLRDWGQHTTGKFAWHLLPGGHFFLHHEQQRLLDLLGQAITVDLANAEKKDT